MNNRARIVNNNEVPPHVNNADNINVDDIVKNNTIQENERICNEFKQIRYSVSTLIALKEKYVKSGLLSKNDFENKIGSTFKLLKEKYEGIYKWCLTNDDVSDIYRMIDSQIAVAEKKAYIPNNH